MNFWKRNKTLHTSEVPPYSRCLTRRKKIKNKKRQIIRNKVITDRKKKKQKKQKQIEQGEENVSAHAHMFESRDCVIGKGARLLVQDS